MNNDELLEKLKNRKHFAYAMFSYTSASTLGPLVVLVIPAYFLDKFLGTKPFIMIVSIFVAFITTNVLLYKKTMMITKNIDKYKAKEREELDKNNK